MFDQFMYLFFLVNVFVILVCMARIIEKKWPIAPTPISEVVDDWKAVSANLTLTGLCVPLSTASAGLIFSALGNGWLSLPTHGCFWFLTLVILAVFADLYSYAFHRLEHSIPFLWAMHSFHHSANALTFATGARHYWIERVMANGVLPIMPILFKIPPDMQLALIVIHFLPDTCAHLNVRFPMGRMVAWLNNPQWHRIHHSVLPQHRDKNFCAVLPLWDILFGTAWIPAPDEYPETGLDPPVRVDVIDSMIWPLRHLRRADAQRARAGSGGDPLFRQIAGPS